MTVQATPEPETAAPFPPYTRVRVTRDSGDSRKGEVLTVEDFVSAAESEEPAGAFYWASTEQGINDRWFAADACELVQTAEDAAARRPPSREEMARSLLLLDSDAVAFDEMDLEGAELTCYGLTNDGLRIAVRLVVQSVEQVDF